MREPQVARSGNNPESRLAAEKPCSTDWQRNSIPELLLQANCLTQRFADRYNSIEVLAGICCANAKKGGTTVIRPLRDG